MQVQHPTSASYISTDNSMPHNNIFNNIIMSTGVALHVAAPEMCHVM